MRQTSDESRNAVCADRYLVVQSMASCRLQTYHQTVSSTVRTLLQREKTPRVPPQG